MIPNAQVQHHLLSRHESYHLIRFITGNAAQYSDTEDGRIDRSEETNTDE